ncbi:MBL fold metallo-hydrolase [Heliobacterium gestii]|uniref:MBL fold metallo-hydrolase n=1 Tax=Heliomicrobium gestii TaxID=2699 RepID=A0A845L9Q6_HELGE|nr:MBL fold metallo-hydrolase [Heliomicrobium gestii]MBM7865401.1 phosphoribosyl 1,2-cyclic phosphodiesterase [Heliomicrobium gestii]MZP41660.1 MBL fold metallo-hydrolase [Heliomicrobium gestii]
MSQRRFDVTFWGVRGSLPIPGPQTTQFGGNTPCVQVRIGDRDFIIDAGSGLYHLGQALRRQSDGPVQGIFLISHLHWDHIQGFPFFGPAFAGQNRFTLYGQAKLGRTFEELFRGQMQPPYFPVLLDTMGAQFDFCDLRGGEVLELDDGVTVRTVLTNHPDECLAFRIEQGGRSCCYLSDTEHDGWNDPLLQAFIAGADLVIYDACYTDGEYDGSEASPPRKGWGHSTWQEGVKLVRAAGAKQLILFHHAMERTDADLARIESLAKAVYPDCLAAREGMTIHL